MTGPAVVWLAIGLLTTLAVLALLIALVRHLLVLWRSLGRFRDEVEPLAKEISALGERASERSERLSADLPRGRR